MIRTRCRSTRLRRGPRRPSLARPRTAGRDPADVTLVAVSKTFPAEAIEPVLAAGQRVFGENCVQEAQGEMAGPARALPRRRAAPHRPAAIEQGAGGGGALRRHRDPRPALARGALARRSPGMGSAPRLLVQVNTGEEPQKGGVVPARGRRVPRRCRDALRPRHRGPDVHPAGGRAALAAFRAARTRSRGATASKLCRWA